jgi:thiamine-monophosphate kinase
MRLSVLGELALQGKIRAGFKSNSRAVITGIGDDAAVLRADRRKLLAATDMMLEGVHFDLAYTTPSQLGFKLVSVNVSDIYAMAGRPAFLLLGVAAPPRTDEVFMDRLLAGVREALGLYGVTLVGGDLSSTKGGIFLSASLLGYAGETIGRGGARPGDRLYVTGPLGESAAGLGLLKVIGRPVDFGRPIQRPLGWAVMMPLLKRHLMPEVSMPPRYATAAVDLSDGLFLDLFRLCAESGTGARVYKGKVPVSEETKAAASYLGLDPFSLAAKGGEDYQLLFAAPSAKRVKNAICIGEIISSGMYVVEEDGAERAIEPEGYRHFA